MNAAWSFSEADLNSKGGRRVRALTDWGGGRIVRARTTKWPFILFVLADRREGVILPLGTSPSMS